MERRLLPLNALIAMCGHGDVYPSPLADAGYQLCGIEVPVIVGDGKVVIDAVAFRSDRNLILAVEGKSGANVETVQAERYGRLADDSLVQAASITIREPGERRVQAVYVCLAENVERVLLGLDEAGLDCPVLAVAENQIEHHGAAFIDDDLEAAFSSPIPVPGPPPRVISVDDESPGEAFDDIVLPGLVAALSNQHPQVSVPALAERVIHHLPVFAKAARNRLIRKVDAAARRAAERDPVTFQYHPATSARDHAIITFLRSPEDAERRGRTQVYQAIARAAGKPLRKKRGGTSDQMALFDDLIDALEETGETDAPDQPTDDENEEEAP